MARKTLIHKHTNLTTNNGGVLSPKLPTVGTLEKGEIAVNYKNGYETLSIENDANEVIPFGSLELTMAYTDAAILGNKPLVIEVNDTDATVPSGTYASITAALAIGREVIVKVINDTGDSDHQYYYITNDHAIVGDGFYEFSSPAKGFYLFRVQIYDDDTFGIYGNDESDMFITSGDAQSITGYKDFTVSPTVPTAESSSNNTTAASTAFVKTALSNQTHGNITNDGKLQTSDISIANGDKLVVTDSSDSNKIARASLSFDGSTTTKALTLKGTWETFLQTESDPTVPNWAKLLNKPTYTLDEVNDGSTRKLSNYLTLSGGTMTGALTLNGAPSSDLHAATKKYVDDSINELPSPMIFKGSLGTGGTITTLPAATTSNEGYTYKVITNGTYGGQSAKIGDTFISDGSNWIYIPSGDEPSGTVTNVKIQATSPIAIDDSSAITTSGVRTISHNDSGVTAGTYKSITVDAKGHVTGGTNPTTLAGYGITDAVTLNTEQTITGQKTFGLYGDERHTYNVCNFYLKTTFKHVVLYTNLPYSSGSFMPVITLKGFLYSTTDLESKITFYIYNNEFYTPRVLHLGAASPIVYLFTYSDNGTERVAVGLEGNFYYLGFLADIHFPALGENYKPKSLWIFNTDNITYDSTTIEENRIIPSIGVNHCVRCGINSLGTTTTGNIAKIGSSTDNAVVRFDGTTSAIQNSGVIIDDSNNLTANSFKKTGGTSSQFLKADGSVDSNTYLTSFTETDPTVPSHVKAITSLNISDWNNKLDEAYYVVNVTSDSQITPPSTVSGTANHYYLDIVTAYNNGKIPIVILNLNMILPFIGNISEDSLVLFGTTVNLYSYLVAINDTVEIISKIGISEADIPITQIQINGSALVPDSQIVDITSIPAGIVEQNSIYRFVNDNEKLKISSAIQGIKVNGTSITPDSNKVVDITIPDGELSSAYLRSTLENEDLVLEIGDSYETAFGKLEKAIIDDEETVAAALNELNDKIKDVDTELDEESENPVQNKAITLAILDNEYVVSVALNNLNDRIQAKLDILISGTNIKTINGTSILGSGNINVSGGSGTGGGGDENIIETIKVNGTALVPDANKAVDISVPQQIVSVEEVGSMTRNNVGGSGTLGISGNIGLFPTVTESGTYIVKTYSSSTTSNYTISIIFGNNTYLLQTTNGSISDSRLLTLSANSSWSGTITSINTGSTLIVRVYKVGSIVTTVGAAAVSNDYNDLDNLPTIPTGGGGGGDENVIETVKVNGTALTPDANKAVNITSIPASIVAQDATHRFVSDTEKTTWNGKQNALLNYIENNGHVDISTYVSEGDINIVSYDDTGGWAVAEAIFGSNGIELNAKQTFTNGEDEIAHNVTLSSEGFKFDNKQIATTDQIPSAVTESTVSGWGFTKNTGTVTSVKINNATKNPTSGVVDLGTVLTSETNLSKGTTSGSGNAVTDISVNGHTITLTKGSTFLTSHQNIKTINNNSLVGTGNISIDTLPTVTSSDNGKILQVVNGAWTLVTPTVIYSGTSTPNNSTGNDGDLYLQTS